MQFSPLESSRFNLRILRGAAETIESYALLKDIVVERADVAILRIPSTEQYNLHKLSLLGFPIIVADTLVYYDCDLQKFPPEDLRNADITARLANESDQDILEMLIEEIFQNYSTHYYSNPLFDSQAILDGYKDWTLSYLKSEKGRICFLFYREGRPIAFATCGLFTNYGEGILYGVHPSAQGGGVYGDLIRYTKKYMMQQGIMHMKVSTQVQNYAVQKVWVREGFFLTNSYCTVHINSLLNK